VTQATISGPLSAAEAAAYAADGYVVPAFRLGEARLAALRAAVEDVLAWNPDVRPEALMSVHIADNVAEGIRGHPAFLDLALDDDILDAVAQAIGPDIVLWGCHLFCKPAGKGLEVPMHQDGHYWPIKPLANCTVWIALDRSGPENGCLRVVPGSHRDRVLYTHRGDDSETLALDQVLNDDAVDLGEAVDVVLEPGQMSLHDIYLVHGSAPNTSGRRRAGLALRYMPATSLFDRDFRSPRVEDALVRPDFARRPIWLARGVDRHGGNDFEIGHAAAAAQ